MATPRVCISSACYDLTEIRDGLYAFIEGSGIEPVMSERGGVFYVSDDHTHDSDSCLHEVKRCDLLVLIIGSRFGGEHRDGEEKSIMNKEYEAAVEKKIPIFMFVKKDVLADHRV